MRVVLLVLCVGGGLAVAVATACLQRNQVYAQPPAAHRAEKFHPANELIALSTQSADGHQQITLIDPRARVMSVYHIDRAQGKISLKSVRDVHWDLLMEEFNGVEPSPREIRSLIQRR